MPFFANKFSQKKTPPRKSPSMSSLHRDLDPVRNQAEFGLNYGQVKLMLGEQEAVFDEGKWVASGKSTSKKDINRVIKEKQRLVEENNYLKVKIEVLLNMLAETTAEVHLQETEIEELKAEVESLKTNPASGDKNRK